MKNSLILIFTLLCLKLLGAVSYYGNFVGNGGGLTNLPAASLTGTVADSLLSSNIARLNIPNTNLQATAIAVLYAGFIVDTTNLNGGTGYTNNPLVTITDATGSNAVITATVSNGVVISLTVQSAGISYSAAPTLTIDPPPSSAYQTFNCGNVFSGVNTFNNPSNTFAGTFTGDGSGLTNLNASITVNDTTNAASSGTFTNGAVVINLKTNTSSGGGVTNFYGAVSTNTVWLSSAGFSGTYTNLAAAIGAVSNLNGAPCWLTFAPGFNYPTPDGFQCCITNVSFHAYGASITASGIAGSNSFFGSQAWFNIYGASAILGGSWTDNPTNGLTAQPFAFYDNPSQGLRSSVEVADGTFTGWTGNIGGYWYGTNNYANIHRNTFNSWSTMCNFFIAGAGATNNRPNYNNTLNFDYNVANLIFTNNTYMNSNLMAGTYLAGVETSADYLNATHNTFNCLATIPTNSLGTANSVYCFYLQTPVGASSTTYTANLGFNSFTSITNNLFPGQSWEIYEQQGSTSKVRLFIAGQYDVTLCTTNTFKPVKIQGGFQINQGTTNASVLTSFTAVFQNAFSDTNYTATETGNGFAIASSYVSSKTTTNCVFNMTAATGLIDWIAIHP